MKLASLDIGLKRVGVSICLMNDIVTPLPAIIRKNRNQAAKDVNSFLEEWKIEKLIIGLPSSNIDTQNRIKHFTNLLDLKIPFEFQEENLSSIEAKELMKGEVKHIRDGRIDSIAAKIILERYLRKKL
ncbi:Holliday junction resolvase RuvX [Arcobacter porcinus]|uniref:Putative pre-16S rRNA nuclease n=1 Tax=Arcobacter porcinus TaxID=1935204 RepID=A0ABX2YB07_9BACT|nr:Holliday junction resolvase RuvX [Arcobacter porcinus]OCL84033.1 putative Holliday junction resolvase [Arcobacter porcinus]OCL84555.1 putative Holliday junction resolvase [Arcobacter porcinus]OCL89097.1 putative Holliday junction resolvase [Arcobacter porcinus]OCL91517.1 putative Holliday junction resolvase [Arcobacter porcinus]